MKNILKISRLRINSLLYQKTFYKYNSKYFFDHAEVNNSNKNKQINEIDKQDEFEISEFKKILNTFKAENIKELYLNIDKEIRETELYHNDSPKIFKNYFNGIPIFILSHKFFNKNAQKNMELSGILALYSVTYLTYFNIITAGTYLSWYLIGLSILTTYRKLRIKLHYSHVISSIILYDTQFVHIIFLDGTNITTYIKNVYIDPSEFAKIYRNKIDVSNVNNVEITMIKFNLKITELNGNFKKGVVMIRIPPLMDNYYNHLSEVDLELLIGLFNKKCKFFSTKDKENLD